MVKADLYSVDLFLPYLFLSVLTCFRRREKNDHYVPVCLPELPDSVSPNYGIVQSAVMKLAEHLKCKKRVVDGGRKSSGSSSRVGMSVSSGEEGGGSGGAMVE
ncbi:unnamed protein product [Lactuca virosa]|uniref:Uncharacterized protein n=1 Tax=Lactuca virosa TaxID=75947 RepID=A0AAU9LST3_9ASTR|nr:unnamed protein product [Lactuca virosa]